MQLRQALLAATERSEQIFRSLPLHFTGTLGESVPMGKLSPVDDTGRSALLLLESIDGVIVCDPPLQAGTLVLRIEPDVFLSEKGRNFVLATRSQRSRRVARELDS